MSFWRILAIVVLIMIGFKIRSCHDRKQIALSTQQSGQIQTQQPSPTTKSEKDTVTSKTPTQTPAEKKAEEEAEAERKKPDIEKVDWSAMFSGRKKVYEFEGWDRTEKVDETTGKKVSAYTHNTSATDSNLAYIPYGKGVRMIVDGDYVIYEGKTKVFDSEISIRISRVRGGTFFLEGIHSSELGKALKDFNLQDDESSLPENQYISYSENSKKVRITEEAFLRLRNEFHEIRILPSSRGLRHCEVRWSPDLTPVP